MPQKKHKNKCHRKDVGMAHKEMKNDTNQSLRKKCC